MALKYDFMEGLNLVGAKYAYALGHGQVFPEGGF